MRAARSPTDAAVSTIVPGFKSNKPNNPDGCVGWAGVIVGSAASPVATCPVLAFPLPLTIVSVPSRTALVSVGGTRVLDPVLGVAVIVLGANRVLVGVGVLEGRVGVLVRVAVGVLLAVGVAVGVLVKVAVTPGVFDGVTVNVGVLVAVGLLVAVGAGELVAVAVAVPVAEGAGVGVDVGAGVLAMGCVCAGV